MVKGVLRIVALGLTLALTAPGSRAADPAPRERQLDYAIDVAPLFNRYGCAATSCHGSLAGKGSFKLALFGADPDSDYYAITRAGGGRRLNRVEPERSLLLLKATGALPHGGAQPISPDSGEARLIRDWIAQGAILRLPNRPTLVSVRLNPAEIQLTPGKRRQVQVTAVYADGALQDVTALASFRSNNPAVAEVTTSGEVVGKSAGIGAVAAMYLRQSAATRVVVPRPPVDPFPAMPANNRIDELVYAQLRALNTPPSALSTDAMFVRRVYLDVIGVLPTAEEVRAFLADDSAEKRAKLIDKLLARDEFVDFWVFKWGDLLRLKAEYPVKLWPKAVQCYARWLRESIVTNKPYDQFVRELLISSGSNFRSGPANFYRAVNNKDPQTFGETTALLFMGARVACARCHGHPYENWGLDDDMSTGAFFAQLRFKNTLEWKEEIVYVDPDARMYNPRTRGTVAPRFLSGEEPKIDPTTDPRQVFAEWLTSPENPWFTRNIANRMWYWLTGRGIIDEPDDLRPTNPPSNPELLDYLASELARHKYDLKYLYRLILNSRTYQLSSDTVEGNRDDQQLFSHYQARRMGAEQVQDAIDQVTQSTESFFSAIPEPYTHLPRDMRAGQVTDGSIDLPFLDLFGRSPRDTPFEADRCVRTSMRQAMFLLNSPEIENKVNNGERIKMLLTTGKSDFDVLEELYLTALARRPQGQEKAAALNYLGQDPKTRLQAMQDLLWAILNTKEFLFIR